MRAIVALLTLYTYDALRGDGYPIRFARLDMLSTTPNLVWALCWAMEALFALAYYGKGKVKRASIVGFWLAYLIIVWSV